jgi:hypothetical protein
MRAPTLTSMPKYKTNIERRYLASLVQQGSNGADTQSRIRALYDEAERAGNVSYKWL